MNVFRYLRFPLLAVLGLVLVVALSSCSKKEVKQDDPLLTGDSSQSEDQSAGSSGEAAADLQTVYFDFDSYSIRADSRGNLKANASWLKKNGSTSVQIEGHCDERGTTEYNIALGERRANAVRDYLVKLGVPTSKLSVISYGKERPQDSGHTEDAWSRNRRAQFVILSR